MPSLRTFLEDPNQRLAAGMISFAAWLALLLLLLFTEHGPIGKIVFASKKSTTAFLAVQVVLGVVALALNGLTLIRGPGRFRLIVLLPLIVLLVYGGMFIAGPG